MAFGSLSGNQRIAVLLELLGGPQYAAQMKAASAATTTLGRSTKNASNEMLIASRRTWMQNQALYTLRRYAFYGTLAVTATGLAVAKLGYSYLAAMQTAKVALSTLFPGRQQVLQGYLMQLFQISKYSPFVIQDIAQGFRIMYPALRQAGMSGKEILSTIRALVDAMSLAGKTGAADFNRVATTLQKVANMGRLTGQQIRSLTSLGIPVYTILNKTLGITRDQLSKIASLNIDPQKFLANTTKYLENTAPYKNAARRISMQTLPGMLQVIRDSLSQISGGVMGGAFKGVQHKLFPVLKSGGPLDRISNIGVNRGGNAAILAISQSVTGNKGLGRGFLLLTSIARNLGAVFAHVVVPAFVMGLHALIVFYPILEPLNMALAFMARHGTILKYVLAALAAEFAITHFAILGMYLGTKALNLMLFGAIGPLKKLIGFMFIWNAQGLTAALRLSKLGKAILVFRGQLEFLRIATYVLTVDTWAWIVANRVLLLTWLGPLGIVGIGITLYMTWKPFRDLMNKLWRDMIYWAPLVGLALSEAFGPIYAAISALLLVIRYWKQIKTLGTPQSTHQGPSWLQWINHIPGQAWISKHMTLAGPTIGHASGGITGGRTLVGENGPEIAQFPSGTRIIPTSHLSASLAMDGIGSSGNGQPILVQLILDRKVLAEAVARANNDRQARR